MTSVSTVRPPDLPSRAASTLSGFWAGPLMVSCTVILLVRKLPCDPAFAFSWSTSCCGSVRVTVPVKSKRTDCSFAISLPVVERLCWGVSDLAAAGAVTPAQADRRPTARVLTRIRFTALLSICTAGALNVTGRSRLLDSARGVATRRERECWTERSYRWRGRQRAGQTGSGCRPTPYREWCH